MKNFDSATMFQDCGVVFPFLESLISLRIMFCLDSFHEFQSQMDVETQFLFPDWESSFLLFVGFSIQNMPNSIDWISLEIISILLVSLILFPSVEHLRLESITVREYGHIIILMSSVQRLQSFVIPLIYGHFLLVFSKFVDHHIQCFQLQMAIFVKLGIVHKFFERSLFAVLNTLL